MKLTDAEMANAFAISKDAMLWRAIIQRLTEQREKCLDSAVGHVGNEKMYSASGEITAAETVRQIIEDFEALREAATKD